MSIRICVKKRGVAMGTERVLFVVDYLPTKANSVGAILNVLLKAFARDDREFIIVHKTDRDISSSHVVYIDGHKTYTSQGFDDRKKLFHLIRPNFIDKQLRKRESLRQLEQIIKSESADMVVFFVFSPDKDYAQICIRNKTNYVWILYDTYIARPGIQFDQGYKIERYVIENSKAYFIPSFFYPEYQRIYKTEKVVQYDLPLLIEKEDVLNAFSRKAPVFDYTYFGQIQSFRNEKAIKTICRRLGIIIDVFSAENYESDDTFIMHEGLLKEALYDVVAHSRFLIAFDNSKPFNIYLPSKSYLYASFTKPVIAFGDNDKSSLKDFFSDYPFFYYQDIHAPLEGLRDFIEANECQSFNVDVYNNYLRYLPQNALSSFVSILG